jgi:hypothetical protein
MTELYYHQSIQKQLVALAELDDRFGPDELICGWYDDLYFPAEEVCPPGRSQVVWDRGQREWRECFTERELEVLAHFHEVFEQHIDYLVTDPPNWRQDARWLAVRDAARVALDQFRSAA